jgi:hypothetical protein
MQELKWLEVLPEQSLEAGIRLSKELGWHLQVREIDGVLFVNSGHTVLLKTSSRESVEALLYGMASTPFARCIGAEKESFNK